MQEEPWHAQAVSFLLSPFVGVLAEGFGSPLSFPFLHVNELPRRLLFFLRREEDQESRETPSLQNSSAAEAKLTQAGKCRL